MTSTSDSGSAAVGGTKPTAQCATQQVTRTVRSLDSALEPARRLGRAVDALKVPGMGTDHMLGTGVSSPLDTATEAVREAQAREQRASEEVTRTMRSLDGVLGPARRLGRVVDALKVPGMGTAHMLGTGVSSPLDTATEAVREAQAREQRATEQLTRATRGVEDLLRSVHGATDPTNGIKMRGTSVAESVEAPFSTSAVPNRDKKATTWSQGGHSQASSIADSLPKLPPHPAHETNARLEELAEAFLSVANEQKALRALEEKRASEERAAREVDGRRNRIYLAAILASAASSVATLLWTILVA